MNTPVDIGRRLEWLRDHHGMTIQQFAEVIGVKYERYYNWESGRSRLSLNGAMQICEQFPVTLDFLYLGRSNTLSVDMFNSWAASARESDTR